MKTTKKILATAAVSAVALGLSGCISVESKPEGAEWRYPDDQTAVTQTPDAGAEESAETEEPITATTEPSDDLVEETEDPDADPDVDETEDPEEDADAVDLSAESGTVYLYPQQAFSPQLQRWVVDGNELYYQQIDCLGRVNTDVEATLLDLGSGEYTATWQGDNPFGVKSPTTDLTITEKALEPIYTSASGIASSRVEAQTDIFHGKCISAGEMVASFIF